MTTSTLPLLRMPTLFLSIQTYDLVALTKLLIAPLSPTQVMKKGSWIWAQGCQWGGKVVGYGDGSVVDGVSSEVCQAATRMQCSPGTKPGRSRIKMRRAQCIK